MTEWDGHERRQAEQIRRTLAPKYEAPSPWFLVLYGLGLVIVSLSIVMVIRLGRLADGQSRSQVNHDQFRCFLVESGRPRPEGVDRASRFSEVLTTCGFLATPGEGETPP